MGRPRQQQLIEDKKDEELTTAAEEYVTVRDKRMRLTMKEVERRAVLQQKMKEKCLTVYRDSDADLVVTLEAKEKVKVRKASEESSDEDAGDGEVDE